MSSLTALHTPTGSVTGWPSLDGLPPAPGAHGAALAPGQESAAAWFNDPLPVPSQVLHAQRGPADAQALAQEFLGALQSPAP